MTKKTNDPTGEEKVSAAQTDDAQETAAAKDERQELIGQLQRLQAEFENYQKRVEREAADTCRTANSQLLREFLPVLDGFELALSNASAAERTGQFHKGVELIYAQLLETLEREGVTPVAAEGERFDPYKHEALLAEQVAGKEKGAILEVLQKGYLLNGKVLRAAKVKVAK